MLLVLPLLIPLATAATCLMCWRSRLLQRALGVAGCFALLAVSITLLVKVQRSGVHVIQIAGWPAPFGITLVADLFAAMMVCVSAVTGAAVAVYSIASAGARRESFGYYPLFHVLLMGVSGAFLTGDIFNLYVWFEVMLIASFVLIALGGEQAQIEGGLKYVTLNLLSSAVFLAAVGLLYGTVGTLNMADLSVRLSQAGNPRLMTTLSVLFLAAFGTKAAMFPFFFWLPASYHTPPVDVGALFAGLLTKVGVYALIRAFTLIFVQEPDYTHSLLLILSGATMITGVLGAIAQNEFRRILSFHIISQIGYMTMGLALFSPLALAASIFYIIHHIIVKTNLFLVSGIAHRLRGTYNLKKLGGLYGSRPALGLLFLVPALSLAGIPPLSGFFAKLLLVRAALQQGSYVITAIAIAVSLLTLFSMTKIWNEAFWKPAADGAPESDRSVDTALWMPVIVLAALTCAIGLGAQFLFDLSQSAAAQLIDRQIYIDAVLGSR
jgi:multicomponent Na+:H+ antiporter subunit D